MTDPELLKAEIDTHWVQAGGGDSVLWIKSLKGRMPYLHLKDFAVDVARNRLFEEIGYGNMDWISIVKAAKAAGCKWYIVEQDDNFEKGDSLKSAKMSFDYIAENLCKD
jgi:sugar phosphate isomerase/epimerase